MNKYIKGIILGFILFLVGIVVLHLETRSYEYSSEVPFNFKSEEREILIPLDEDEKLEINNNFNGKNIYFYIDNTLEDEVKIVSRELDINEVSYNQTFKTDENKTVLNIDSEFNLNEDNLYDVFKFAFAILKDKKIYNYTALKYPIIEVYVNEDDKDKIEVLKGKTTEKAYETGNTTGQ